jgi:hypothetical protein
MAVRMRTPEEELIRWQKRLTIDLPNFLMSSSQLQEHESSIEQPAAVLVNVLEEIRKQVQTPHTEIDKNAVYEAFPATGGASLKELVDATNLPEPVVERILAEFLAESRIAKPVSVGSKVYYYLRRGDGATVNVLKELKRGYGVSHKRLGRV